MLPPLFSPRPNPPVSIAEPLASGHERWELQGLAAPPVGLRGLPRVGILQCSGGGGAAVFGGEAGASGGAGTAGIDAWTTGVTTEEDRTKKSEAGCGLDCLGGNLFWFRGGGVKSWRGGIYLGFSLLKGAEGAHSWGLFARSITSDEWGVSVSRIVVMLGQVWGIPHNGGTHWCTSVKDGPTVIPPQGEMMEPNA